MMGLVGIWNIIQGILAVIDSNVFDDDAHFVFSNLSTWGWISIVLGTLLILSAVGLVRGSVVWTWVGVGIVSLNALSHLSEVSYQPFWGLTMFAVDVFILYALVVYGGARVNREIKDSSR